MAILQRLPPCETTLILVGLFVRSSCQAACPKHQAQSSFFNNPHFAVRSSPRQAFQPASWGLSVQSIRLLRRHGGRPVFGSIGEHVVSSCGLWSMFFRATTGVEALGAEHPISNLDLPANVPSSCYSLRESPTQRPHSQMMRHRSIKSSSLARHHQCHSLRLKWYVVPSQNPHFLARRSAAQRPLLRSLLRSCRIVVSSPPAFDIRRFCRSGSRVQCSLRLLSLNQRPEARILEEASQPLP